MLAFLIIFLGIILITTPVSAAPMASIVSSPSQATLDSPFDVQTSINDDPNTSYYIKGRIGISPSTLTKGLTNNPQNTSPDDWLTDNDNWSKFPTITTNNSGLWAGSLKLKTSSTATTGDNLLVFRIRKVGSTTNYDSASKTISLSTTSSSSPTPVPSVSSPSSISSDSSSSFTISGTPSQINSDQSFTASVNLTLPDSPNTNFYLKGAFKKQDGSNYFGLTKVSGNWIKNNSTYSNQYPITTNSSGNWSGNLEIQPDADDSGFSGSDNYIFKAGRYTSSGSGPTWSNETTLKITDTSTQNQGSASETTSQQSASQTNPTAPSQVSKTNPAIVSKSKNYDTPTYQSASIAGTTTIASPSATPSANIKVANQKQNNLLILIGSLFVLVGTGSLGFIIYKNKIK